MRIILDLEDADLVEGSLRTDVGHLFGLRDIGDSLPTVAAETITFSDPRTRGSVRYVLRARGPNPLVNVTVASEKGGTHRRRVRLTESGGVTTPAIMLGLFARDLLIRARLQVFIVAWTYWFTVRCPSDGREEGERTKRGQK